MRHVQTQHQAMASPRVREPELEEDGLPSQVPPPANRRRDPDDPSEPFSPNYGKPGNGLPAPALQRTTLAPTPDDVPVSPRKIAGFRAE